MENGSGTRQYRREPRERLYVHVVHALCRVSIVENTFGNLRRLYLIALDLFCEEKERKRRNRRNVPVFWRFQSMVGIRYIYIRGSERKFWVTKCEFNIIMVQ